MPLRHPVKYVYIGHREQGDKGAVAITQDQWIATGLRPRDDKGVRIQGAGP